jgi:hypothetical protein
MGFTAVGTARADCEADMVKLDQGMRASILTPGAKTILHDARKKAVEAVKKDDVMCNKVMTAALTRAGLKM